MEQNYRSTSTILQAALHVIVHGEKIHFVASKTRYVWFTFQIKVASISRCTRKTLSENQF